MIGDAATPALLARLLPLRPRGSTVSGERPKFGVLGLVPVLVRR